MESRPLDRVMNLFGHLQNLHQVLNGSDDGYQIETEIVENNLDKEQEVRTVVLTIFLTLIPIIILSILITSFCKSCCRVYKRKGDRQKLIHSSNLCDLENDAESGNTDFSDFSDF